MSDPSTDDPRRVDPGRDTAGNPFDSDHGLYGQDYHRDKEAELGRQAPAGTVAKRPTDRTDRDSDLPPDNGLRASFDPATGEVHGSGAGAGGGNPDENFDSDLASEDDPRAIHRAPGEEGAPDDLGPPHTSE